MRLIKSISRHFRGVHLKIFSNHGGWIPLLHICLFICHSMNDFIIDLFCTYRIVCIWVYCIHLDITKLAEIVLLWLCSFLLLMFDLEIYWNVLGFACTCTGMYWNFEILIYWKKKNVLESVLEYTGISPSNLAGHPEETLRAQLGQFLGNFEGSMLR